MSTLVVKNIQVGDSATPANNVTIYQPSTPDGGLRIGQGNSEATTGDIVAVKSTEVIVNKQVLVKESADLMFVASSTNPNEPGDVVFQNNAGAEIARIYTSYATGSPVLVMRVGSNLSDVMSAYEGGVQLGKTPTAPNAPATTNTTQIATTAFAQAMFDARTSAFSRTLLDDPDAATARATLGAYGTNNIVGTVSQSGGVPTGAIIEQGSNANGTYIKYADGTMICRHKGDISWVQARLTFKSVEVLFPGAFVSSDISLLVTPISAASGGSMLSLGAIAMNGLYYTVHADCFYITSFAYREATETGAVLSYAYIAMGRWY